MRQVLRLLQVQTDSLAEPEDTDAEGEYAASKHLSGYLVDEPVARQSAFSVRACRYVMVVTGLSEEPEAGRAGSVHPRSSGELLRPLRLLPVGRVLPIALPKGGAPPSVSVPSLRAVRSGQAYRISSPPARGLVRPVLAEALETVFERFAQQHGFTSESPLEIHLARGFKAGSWGHGEGRAADIASVGGKSLLDWKKEWDEAMARTQELTDADPRAEAVAAEQKRNLGFGLYKALQEHGGWRVNPEGWRRYRGVAQLFGPWTATEGPWKAMEFKDPTPYQRQRLADQQWVFQAHKDHIHVAK